MHEADFTDADSIAETKRHMYEVQCRDYEDHIDNEQFFKIGAYACQTKDFTAIASGTDNDNSTRAFECISDKCSYNEPVWTEVDNAHWRLSRALPVVVPRTEELETRDCDTWMEGYPYLHGSFVCNDNMVWMCFLANKETDEAIRSNLAVYNN